MSNTSFSIINDSTELFNLLFQINNKNLLFLNEAYVPISNKYYITILDTKQKPFSDFFNYIFDETREIEPPFIVDPDTDTKLKWDKEQYYFIELGEKNFFELENDLAIVHSEISDSNGSTILLIDIDYLINHLIECAESDIPTHIYDFLLFQLKKFNFESVIIFDSTNEYNKSNLLYEQIKLNFNVINKSESKFNQEQLQVYNKIDSMQLNIFWNMINQLDVVIEKKVVQLESDLNSGTTYWYGYVNNTESFISKVKIIDIIDKNIFELNKNSGIILDPLDKIYYF